MTTGKLPNQQHEPPDARLQSSFGGASLRNVTTRSDSRISEG